MGTTDPHVVLQPIAKEHAPVLQNLFQFYAHDFSEHVPLDLDSNGRFDVAPSDAWWTGDASFPFFIRYGGKLSGFALVKKGSRITEATDVSDVAEFFVIRGARRRGVGTSAAHALLAAFPGAWEIRVRRTNVAALQFWSRAVETWVGGAVKSAPWSSEGVEWDVLRVGSSVK